MQLSPDEVKKIAKLSRLELSEEECESFRGQLSSILDYVGKLSEVDVEGVEPMSHSVPIRNVLRDDVPTSCGAGVRDAIVAAFPEKEGDLLKVKSIF